MTNRSKACRLRLDRLAARMTWVKIGIACLCASTAAASSLSSDVTITSDYDYRGVTQTTRQPAVQLGLDYNAGPAHLQVWTSNVDFERSIHFYGKKHTEVAYTADLSTSPERAVQLTAGVSYFTYPGWQPNPAYAEAFLTVLHGPCSVSMHYSWTYDNLHPRLEAYYVEGNYTLPLGHSGFDLIAHLGDSFGVYWNRWYGGSYADFSAGLARKVGRLDIAVRVVRTLGYPAVAAGEPFSAVTRSIVSFTLPLGERE